MNKSAVVFGATGLVGKELVFELLENNGFQSVKTVLRKVLPIQNPKLDQMVVSDLTLLEPIQRNLSADVFFCCIGTTIKTAGSQDAFRKVDLDIPVSIARLAESLGIPNLVIISSIGANANSSNFYLRTKGEMEQKVKSLYSGNLKIVRPSFLIGNRAEFRLGEKIGIYLAKILGIVMLGPLARYKGIQSWNVARAMVESINLPKEKVFLESDELQNLAKKGKHSDRKP